MLLVWVVHAICVGSHYGKFQVLRVLTALCTSYLHIIMWSPVASVWSLHGSLIKIIGAMMYNTVLVWSKCGSWCQRGWCGVHLTKNTKQTWWEKRLDPKNVQIVDVVLTWHPKNSGSDVVPKTGSPAPKKLCIWAPYGKKRRFSSGTHICVTSGHHLR